MDSSEARTILEPCRYERPPNYIGATHEGTYTVATVHRDSDTVSRANWLVWTEDVLADALAGGHAYIARASHWAVGWIDTLQLSDEAPDAALVLAADALYSLEQYPVLDEDRWTELEQDDADEAWESWARDELVGAIRELAGDDIADALENDSERVDDLAWEYDRNAPEPFSTAHAQDGVGTWTEWAAEWIVDRMRTEAES